MGSSPKAPYYDIRQAEQQQDYMRDKAKNDLYLNYKSGLGGYTYDPESGYMNVNYTPADQNRLILIDSGVKGLDLDPNEATDRYFNRAMENIQPEIDKYLSRTSANLVNKGIPIGSQAYNEVMRQQDNNISNQIANIYSNARSQALNDTAAQINNIGGVQSQVYQPQYIAGLGATGLQNLYTSQFQNEMDRYNAAVGSSNANTSATMGTIGALGAAAIMAMSDKKVKENLIPVGKLDNGLTVYVGNYKEEIDPNKMKQLFLIAQEVKEIHPEAVQEFKVEGFDEPLLAVDYAKAVLPVEK
jgi:hypothetical protein